MALNSLFTAILACAKFVQVYSVLKGHLSIYTGRVYMKIVKGTKHLIQLQTIWVAFTTWHFSAKAIIYKNVLEMF